MMNLTDVFIKNLEAYQQDESLIINQGGQGSSKTYSILQLIYFIARKEAKRITVASYALPHLKAGAMADFDAILRSVGEDPSNLKNISESSYHIGKSTITFFGIEGNLARAHGVRRDILFINEVNHKVTYEVYDQLASRTQGTVFIDYNPTQEFWLQETVIPNFKHKMIISTYLDNPFLPDSEVRNILAKKDKLGFENWWKVYGLGQLGKLEGCIFMNWSNGEFDTNLPAIYGLDFGFNAPDALVKIAVDNKRKIIYWDERVYKSGNSSADLKNLIAKNCTRNNLIIADCADARLINDMKKYFNIKPTNKQTWTVSEAIKLMQNYEMIITDNSQNLAKEFNNYLWSDKKAGIPVDAFNHLIDAGRYAFLVQYRQTETGRQKWHG